MDSVLATNLTSVKFYRIGHHINKQFHQCAHVFIRKSELETKIRRQVACEERAHRLVEQLLENPVSENFLMEAVSYIYAHKG